MGRPKLKEKDKKTKLGISISREINDKIEKVTNNKSKFIEHVINAYFDSNYSLESLKSGSIVINRYTETN